MKNNKGQALVEFIMIMPIMLIIIMSMVDLGNIIVKKYTLENNLDTVVDYYKNEESAKIVVYAQNEGITVTENALNNNLVEIKVSKSVKTTAPIMRTILGKNVLIEAERQVYEKE